MASPRARAVQLETNFGLLLPLWGNSQELLLELSLAKTRQNLNLECQQTSNLSSVILCVPDPTGRAGEQGEHDYTRYLLDTGPPTPLDS